MTAIDYIRELLHHLASLLVWPVLIGLIAMLAFALIATGSFLRELWRRRTRATGLVLIKRLDEIAAELPDDVDLDLRLEEAIQLHDQRQLKSLQFLRLAVRLGPSLGLMGTLIPMADALQGLADGNLPRLASNMVTAFAATVIGLLISVLAYVISATRESWARDDSRAAAFTAERLLRAAARNKRDLTPRANEVTL
jgi:biopolymer transport protein ExbB/TolQ